VSDIRCPHCGNEAPRETFESAFEVLGAYMNQPVIKCKKCGAVLMETGRFRKKWFQLQGERAELMEANLSEARNRFQAGLQDE
jgi:transcription initiation factor IIE alpha subunit